MAVPVHVTFGGLRVLSKISHRENVDFGSENVKDSSWKTWSTFRAAVVLPYDAQTLVPCHKW